MNREKIVLAYSGGLDTSIILKWLQKEKNYDVITFTADIGQTDEIGPAREKAVSMGAKEIFIEDLKEEFTKNYLFPMFRANALYEGAYMLGTAIARPLIGKRLVEIAHETNATTIAHGATGKGNDQVRFELAAYALDPNIKVVAPWREWKLNSRTKLIKYAEENQIPFPKDKRGEQPYSMDANLLHISYEGKALEDPWVEPEEDMFRWTISPQQAPNEPEYITIGFSKGDPISINDQKLSAGNIMQKLNELGVKHGIGRLDIVENRYVGMKSRGVYETPGGTILLQARRAIESITIDREVAHLKDELMPKYAELVYNGYWFTPEREVLQTAIDATQYNVNGVTRLKLYKGNTIITGRQSPTSLYSNEHVTFEEDSVYNQLDAEGFIKLNALRLKIGKHYINK
ncbi:MAG: argininosuccinate synthase [Alphaproteobacteria bacterium TMED87]|nr:argininosuccinate synthase [Rhodospirillaceae bacterium]OUV08205.1 MAG: argininosuccinate synthase [Alphaproteobacteria bacterium TMED87]